MYKLRRFISRLFFIIIILIILINLLVILQVHSISHLVRGAEPIEQTIPVKIKSAFLGLTVPRPETTIAPSCPYSIEKIYDNKGFLDGWLIPVQDSVKAKGIVVLFHGYLQEKSAMLEKAYVLRDMGYDTMLMSFMGCGLSYGNQTTIGGRESDNVKAVYDYLIREYEYDSVYLLGFSMGAVAITKAMHDYNLNVSGVILEAAYGRMFDAVNVRIRRIGLPETPLNYVATFWLGAINGFNAFKCNPQDYAVSISAPALVLCGGKDINVTEEETQRIFEGIKTDKKIIKIFPKAGHESYLDSYKQEWIDVMAQFLEVSST